jgi:hypothetical protein
VWGSLTQYPYGYAAQCKPLTLGLKLYASSAARVQQRNDVHLRRLRASRAAHPPFANARVAQCVSRDSRSPSHGENLRHKRVVARHGHHTCAKPGVYEVLARTPRTRRARAPTLHTHIPITLLVLSSLSLMATTETAFDLFTLADLLLYCYCSETACKLICVPRAFPDHLITANSWSCYSPQVVYHSGNGPFGKCLASTNSPVPSAVRSMDNAFD